MTKFDDDGKYSWVKSPRFDGRPMQVGPLAQVLVGFALGHEPTVRWAKKTLETAGKVAGVSLGPEVLHSTLGRHAAHMIRTCVMSELAQSVIVCNVEGRILLYNGRAMQLLRQHRASADSGHQVGACSSM